MIVRNANLKMSKYFLVIFTVDMIFFSVFFGRFGVMNRKLLEPLYPDASKIAPNFWPDYDKRYTSLTPESILQRS